MERIEKTVKKKSLKLRDLPSVDELVRDLLAGDAMKEYSASFVTDAARQTLKDVRAVIMDEKGEVFTEDLPGLVLERIARVMVVGVRRVVNATGTILHTNLGRAILSEEALQKALLAGGGYSSLEFDLERGKRGERDKGATALLKTLTGCEDAAVVNNNAAAVLITLNTLAEGREVLISRGELIEIGGAFRLPEIIEKSGCILKEVGTTNRTHPGDYERAVTEDTALILKAHTSNFSITGFTSEVSLKELVDIGRRAGVPVVEDLGSGALVDLSAFGLPKEPIVGESLSSGAGCVTFSGDKLLGGPQAGIIAGEREIIDRIRRNPLKRALRVDKMTIAALEATLKLYYNPDTLAERLPTLKTMTRDIKEIEGAARTAVGLLKRSLGEGFSVAVQEGVSVVGGGSMPEHTLPTWVVAVTHGKLSAEAIFSSFLRNDPPVLGRIHKDKFLLDLRTVKAPEDLLLTGPNPAGKAAEKTP